VGLVLDTKTDCRNTFPQSFQANDGPEILRNLSFIEETYVRISK